MQNPTEQQNDTTENPRSAELNLLVRTAALRVDPQGRVSVLAKKAGVSKAGVLHAIRRGSFSAGMACALEVAVGREYLPKEKLCPEKYGI